MTKELASFTKEHYPLKELDSFNQTQPKCLSKATQPPHEASAKQGFYLKPFYNHSSTRFALFDYSRILMA